MRTRRIALLAVSALLVLTACKATFQDPVLGSDPAKILAGAVKSFEKGVNFSGAVTKDGRTTTFRGSEAADGSLRLLATDPSVTTFDTRWSAGEMWISAIGNNAPDGWGHMTTQVDTMRGLFGAYSPAETMAGLLEDVDAVERTGKLRYEGVLDYGGSGDRRLAMTKYSTSSLEDADEVDFLAVLNPDGTISSFGYTVDGFDVVYNFSEYGAPEAPAKPGDGIKELAGPEEFLRWLLGTEK
ncbi:hypothetical protein Afil01_56530 [Actinorhabdospora filicis]|uniref:Lipoprotein n=1 Tax=Actinorhabdospora filicis TaxID=1785913 RepID=A0A9W6SU85_9ACTN|nr:hypothetical protein [Actinorhabdospora filicis]GLZ80846.1 hypothetical protein Afil01_56530 [Actinorhabdospora filicis]